MIRRNGQRSKQENANSARSRMPQPDRSDHSAKRIASNERQPIGRQPAATQLLRRLAATMCAHGSVEQRFARANVTGLLQTNGKRGASTFFKRSCNEPGNRHGSFLSSGDSKPVKAVT
jgi:hypothetical protein